MHCKTRENWLFSGLFFDFQVISTSEGYQEPLNAPFLSGLFSTGFSRGKTAHQGIRGNSPLRSENGPLRRGNAPLMLMGSFQSSPSPPTKIGFGGWLA